MVAEALQSGKPRLLLTAAVAADVDMMTGYDVPEMVNSLDFLNVMTYDFWYPSASGGETGTNSALYNRAGLLPPQSQYNTNWTAHAWHNRGFPKAKIVIGIEPYGHGWVLKNSSAIQPGSIGNTVAPAHHFSDEVGMAAYFEICEMLAAGATRYWQAEQKVPWLIIGKQWWSYDDVQSVKIKMAYIKANGFGGAMVWALDLDDFNGKCSNGGGKLYPIIATIAQELAGIII
ncbi:unnamed protein product, partial [Mesorhabditis belari]|uniref:GH18 domain-containing protein n=1 Tax=Mesorhabditis belari TaxID=2138241 RepID=A0AAF3EML6_9BILA